MEGNRNVLGECRGAAEEDWIEMVWVMICGGTGNFRPVEDIVLLRQSSGGLQLLCGYHNRFVNPSRM
jgi:hypothetical protein